MSQAKVDRYKEEKQKREKLQKKEKRELLLWKIVGIIVLVALVGWIGFSVYQNVQKDASHTYEMKTDALDHYMNGLNAETETSSEASTETTEKTTEETAAETSAESTVPKQPVRRQQNKRKKKLRYRENERQFFMSERKCFCYIFQNGFSKENCTEKRTATFVMYLTKYLHYILCYVKMKATKHRNTKSQRKEDRKHEGL